MHMHTDAVVKADGSPIPEHFLDAMVTAACALHDVRGARANSRVGSIYIVKPKMHGAAEVQLACDLFAAVERTLDLPRNTLKMGVMDEERRTSVNLASAIAPARDRIVFVNTGFLDRTADEIHTSMLAGPILPKAELKGAWYEAYESNNVETCVRRALVGVGQIGKGMWAAPDDMRSMMEQKGAQLDAGASTAWVPSPTAATLHAIHYLRTSVASVQAGHKDRLIVGGELEGTVRHDELLGALLEPPLMGPAERAKLTNDRVQTELDENVQALLGYVVRWVGQGVGCSKVPNMAGLQLMEDRATLRISSQHLANWLHHGVVSEEQMQETLHRVAKVVDTQNANEVGYKALAPAYDGPEWHAAIELIWNGLRAPNGYTEPSLTKWRRKRKAMDAQALMVQARAEKVESFRDEPALEPAGPSLFYPSAAPWPPTNPLAEPRLANAVPSPDAHHYTSFVRSGDSMGGAV